MQRLGNGLGLCPGAWYLRPWPVTMQTTASDPPMCPSCLATEAPAMEIAAAGSTKISLLQVPQTTPLECHMIQVSSLVFIAQSIPSPPQVAGTLDETGDPRLWFRVAGRLSTGPHREKETITALEICFLTATELVRLVRAKELSALELTYGGAPSADRACQP